MKKVTCECGHVNPEGTILCEACGKPLDDGGDFINQEAHGGPLSEQQVEIHYFVLPDFIMNQMYIEEVDYAPTFLYESIRLS